MSIIHTFFKTWRRLWNEEAELRIQERRFDYRPESEIVRDQEATRQMHEFLLTIDSGSASREIAFVKPNGDLARYEVGVVQIDQAPLIPPKPRTNG